MKRPFPFPLRLPVFCAPMFLVSGPDLVSAACEAGVVGAYPAVNCRTPPDLDKWTADIGGRVTGKARAPWAMNLITHSTYKRLKDELEIVARHKPPIVITALGSPKPVIDVVHSYGGLVFADVVSIKMAKKAAKLSSKASALLDAQVEWWLARLDAKALEPWLEAEVDALLHDASKLKLEEVVSRKTVQEIARH